MIDVAKLIAYALTLTKIVESGKVTLAEIRSTLAREAPESLNAFDATVASARAPWQQAADAATSEEGR